MKSRLDRYNVDESSEKKIQQHSRLSRNKHLYDDLNNKIGFEELVDFNTQTRIELSSLNEPKKSRESYQQLKDYQGLLQNEEEKKEEIVEEEEEKVFDINSILEEARKNRSEIDELEKKRKLKSEEYNVLSDLNKKYLSNKKEEEEKDEYEGLEELINTITSKTLANDIKEEANKEDKGLLGDLVATNVELQVNSPSEYEIDSDNKVSTVIPEEDDDDDDDEQEERTVDNSFYTRSMDLSEQDFEFDEARERSSSIKKRILITVITIILLVIIAVVAYFVLQHFGIKIDINEILK